MTRKLDMKLNFWLDRDLFHRVQDKTKREAVNISALLRAMLVDWLAGQYNVHSESEADR